MDKENVLYKMKCHSVMRNKTILQFVKTCMDSVGIMLSELSQTEKENYFMLSLIYGIFKSQTWETESRMVVSRGWACGGMVEMLLKGYAIAVRRWISLEICMV